MSGTEFGFSIDDAAKSYEMATQYELAAQRLKTWAAEAREVDDFTNRVRLPGSGAVARLFGRLEAWKAARVERQAQAQAAFAMGYL